MKLIRVPATSANLGPGFDSLGVAISLYLELKVLAPSETWFIAHNLGKDIPNDHNNLIIQTALELIPNLTPHHLQMTSEIPPARGLGSSSAAIVAGIELANLLGNLELTADEKIQWASKIEGHPDNVMPAIIGGFVVGAVLDDHVYWKKIPFPDVAMIVCVPEHQLKTIQSRTVLPANLTFEQAVKGSSLANVLLASLQEGDLITAGKMIESDIFHEPYRAKLIPELNHVRSIGHEEAAYGTYISGAGTAVMTMISPVYAKKLRERLQIELPHCRTHITHVDGKGSVIL